MLTDKTHHSCQKFLLAGNEPSCDRTLSTAKLARAARRYWNIAKRRKFVRRRGTPIEAAMKGVLPSLMGIVFCALALNSAAADPTTLLPTEPGEEWHAAVTDTPNVIDMSHADPKTWHSLPPTAGGAYVRQEVAEKRADRGNG